MTFEDLVREALKLEPQERARIARRLLDSLTEQEREKMRTDDAGRRKQDRE